MITSAKVLGGPKDGTVLLPFPVGEWHKNADGWPLVLHRDGYPTLSGLDGTEFYHAVKTPTINGQELLYVWRPVLDGWTALQQRDAS